jgi:hypothetical protein
MKAKDFDRKFDRGESVLPQLDLSKASRGDDPIVEEIHRIRDQMLAECGGDFQKYMDRIRDAEEQDADRLVTKEEVLRLKTKHSIKS